MAEAAINKEVNILLLHGDEQVGMRAALEKIMKSPAGGRFG